LRLFSKDDEPRVIKPAGKPAFVGKTLAGQPRMHGTEAEFTLGRLAGASLRDGERPAMDRNRRP
jgi:hypothetical protein